MYKVRRHTHSAVVNLNSPSTALAPQSIIQLIKHEHYDTKHCGTRPNVSDERMSPTNVCLRQMYTKDNIERTSAAFRHLAITRQPCGTYAKPSISYTGCFDRSINGWFYQIIVNIRLN